MLVDEFTVNSPNVVYTEDTITTTYDYKSTELRQDAQGKWIVEPTSTQYEFQVDRKVPKLGCVVFVVAARPMERFNVQLPAA